MSEIVEHMKFITRFFPKGDDPLVFPDCEGSVATDECDLVSLIQIKDTIFISGYENLKSV